MKTIYQNENLTIFEIAHNGRNDIISITDTNHQSVLYHNDIRSALDHWRSLIPEADRQRILAQIKSAKLHTYNCVCTIEFYVDAADEEEAGRIAEKRIVQSGFDVLNIEEVEE